MASVLRPSPPAPAGPGPAVRRADAVKALSEAIERQGLFWGFK